MEKMDHVTMIVAKKGHQKSLESWDVFELYSCSRNEK